MISGRLSKKRKQSWLWLRLFMPGGSNLLDVVYSAPGMDHHAAEGSNVSDAEPVGLDECVQLLRGPSDERR